MTKDEDYDALSQKHLASIKRDTRVSLEDAAVRAITTIQEALAQPEQEPNGYVQTVIEALYENGDPVSVDAAELLQRITAQQEQEPEAWHDKIIGIEVSMDVSTGEDDAYHRVFGRVYEVMLEKCGALNDIILAIEDARNFTSPPKREPDDFDSWYASPYAKVLMKSIEEDYQPKRKPLEKREIMDVLMSVDPEAKRLAPGFEQFARAIEAAHGIKEKNHD